MSKVNWTTVKEYTDITYKKSGDGVARIAFNRPEVRNAFRPKTVGELFEALLDAREDTSIGVYYFLEKDLHQKMVDGLFAQVVTKMPEDTKAMLMMTVCQD